MWKLLWNGQEIKKGSKKEVEEYARGLILDELDKVEMKEILLCETCGKELNEDNKRKRVNPRGHIVYLCKGCLK